MEWAFGIFTLMTIMSGVIGAILVVQLTYIDRQYKDAVKDFEMAIQNLKDKKSFEEKLSYATIYSKYIGEYNGQRHENRTKGALYDLLG